MNATQAENLRILIAHMETGCARDLFMDAFTTSCGTPACAAGEACIVPQFRAQGLCTTPGGMPLFHERVGGDAMQALLGIKHDDRYRLFGQACTNYWRSSKVTPQEWALEARKVLAENGYSMDERKPIPSVAERLEAVLSGAACPDWKSDHKFTDSGGKAGVIVRAERATEESLRGDGQ